jgi:Luciferase-like monooxygenase
VIDQVAMAAPAADQSAAALGAFFGKRPSGAIAKSDDRRRVTEDASPPICQHGHILPFRNPLLVADEAAMLDNLTGGPLDLGLGRGLRPPEFEAFAVDQARSREMFVESFNLIRRIWADENFVHHGKYWTVVKNGPLSPPLVQRPHRRSSSARPEPESQVRIRLPAGGSRIRTLGPYREGRRKSGSQRTRWWAGGVRPGRLEDVCCGKNYSAFTGGFLLNLTDWQKISVSCVKR